MLEISKIMVDTIEGDTTIDSLLGASESDSRVYAWSPDMRIAYSTGIPAALIYHISFGKRGVRWSYPSQKGNGSIIIKILSIDQLKANQLADKLIDLFDIQSFQSTNWNVGHSELIGNADTYPEGDPTKPIYTKTMTFLLSNIFKRSS